MAKHQDKRTRFSKDGCTAFVHLRVDRRAYEFARFWAAYHAGAEPTGTAEDHLEGYLNVALTEHMEDIDWMAPPDIEALYPKMPDKAPGDWDDDIPF